MFLSSPFVILVWLFAVTIAASAGENESRSKESPVEAAEDSKKLFTGKVLLLGEALEKKGIESTEEMHKQVALVTPGGEIIPIVADWRGRAFFQDKRLRKRKVELVGARKPGQPYLQVQMVFTYGDKGQRMYTDYWCDICSIPMYEIQPCECCQGDVRLRFQPQDLPGYLETSKKNETPAGKSDR